MKNKKQTTSNIFIDQSGKVEDTGRPTVVAYANHRQKSLLIKAQDKRDLQSTFRQANKPKIFKFAVFATLVYLLVKDSLRQISSITIDQEYTGKDDLIKNFLINLIRKEGKVFAKENIHFGRVGKKHNCHKRAISVLRKHAKADIIITKKEVLHLII